MSKDTFGKLMPKTLDQEMKQMGEQIKLARKRRHKGLAKYGDASSDTGQSA
ncbi:MAG: hypothetical protein MJY70_01845 [Bacteroidales bacterium]|nr:hypothetical protein [Bacteroidales bacterium]